MTLVFNPRTMEWETKGAFPQPRPTSKPIIAKPPAQDDIMATIRQHPIYGFADRLARYLFQAYELPEAVSYRNRRGSCFDPNTKYLYFGYESLRESYNVGFAEYVTISPVWGYHGISGEAMRGYYRFSAGLKGVWMEVLHEFAHVLQDRQNGARFGDIHNDNFRKNLDELITLFPYDECVTALSPGGQYVVC